MNCLLSRLIGPALAIGLWASSGEVWCQASAPAIPYRSAAAGDSPDPQQWLLAVLGCALLLAAVIFAIRRFGARLPRLATQRRHVKVMERTSLAHGTQLVVVEYGDRRLLLSVTSTGSTCLRDDPVTIAALSRSDGAGT